MAGNSSNSGFRLTGHVPDLLGDPEAFLRELNRPSVTVETLQQHRTRVQSEADQVNVALKKNVYKNYALFIDSAKMISLLKNEMFTLSRLLSNQQALMSNLTDIAISGDRTHGLTLNEKKEVAAKFRTNTGNNNMSDSAYSSKSSESSSTPTRNPVMTRSATSVSCSPSSTDQVRQVIDRIEGCASILETRNRLLLNQGELTELDPDDYKKVPSQGKTLLVLLNDCLILAQAFPFPSRAGKKYKFQALFELDNIAVVNVKDAAGLRSAFKILMFPQTKVYDAETPECKKKWLDSFDSAKKNRRTSLSLQRRDSIMFNSMDSQMAQQQLAIGRDPQQGQGKKLMSPVDRNVYSFDEELEDVSESESEMIPVWLQEFPDDMDVLIAQRNFEDAVSLVLKVNDHLILYPKCYEGFFHNDLRLRVNHKIQELVDRISNELQVTGDRSLQHGPRAARRAVHLLLKLGKSPLATKLFLDQRSAILKTSMKQQLLHEGSALPFVSKLCRSFVNNLIETSRDFENAFRTTASLLHVESHAGPAVDSAPTSLSLDHRQDSLTTSVNGDIRSPVLSYPPSYPTACLVVWCQKEILNFTSTFSRNVFLPSVPLATLCESVSVLRNETNRLRNLIGMDFLFYVDNQIREDILKTIEETRKRVTDELKAKFREEDWQSVNFKSVAGISRYWEDVRDANLVKCIQSFVFDEFKLSLSVSTTFFAKHLVSMTSDFMKISTPFTHPHIIKCLMQVFKLFMEHLKACLRSESLRREAKFIRRNATFLLDQVCKLVDNLYLAKTGSRFRELETMRQDFEHLKDESSGVGESGGGKSDVRKDFSRSNSKSSTTSSPHHHNNSTSSSHSSSPEKKRSPSKSTISITEVDILMINDSTDDGNIHNNNGLTDGGNRRSSRC